MKNSVTAAIDGTIDLQKDINTEHIITTALKSQHKMLTRQDDRYLRTATKNNIKTYNKILQNSIEKESVSLQSKIEAEANRQKYRKLVRPWHRAKQIQACYIDDYFDIYGSYHAQMMYPGDLNGGAENVANCRCWIQYTNTPPSNLKTKGIIQVNPNLKFTDIFRQNKKIQNTENIETHTRKTNNNQRTATSKTKTKNNIKNNTIHNQNKYTITRKIKNKINTVTSNTKNKVINVKNKTVQSITYDMKKIINKGYVQYTTDDNKHNILIKEIKNPKKFKEKLIEAYHSQPKKDAWRVDLGYAPGDYIKYGCKMYITKNGSIVAIKPDGDIISVCANANGKKDSTRALLEFATKNGGTKLDSYDGNYGFYRRCGFKPVSYCLGEEDYYPDAWKKGRKEKQDEFEKENIMFFIYNGKPILKAKLEDWYVNDKKKSLAKNYSDAESKRDEVLEEWKKKGIL